MDIFSRKSVARRELKRRQQIKRSSRRRISKCLENLEGRQMMAGDLGLAPEPAPAAEVSLIQAPASNAPTVSSDSAVENAKAELREQADRTGQIVLDELDQFATFAGITIVSPTFDSEGNVSGTTQIGDSLAPVLLQYVPQHGDWVLAIQSELGDLIPNDSPLQSPVTLESPIFVFSPAEMTLESSDLPEGAHAFYERLYESDDFKVRLQRGVNLLTRGTIADGPVSDILGAVGLEVPSIEFEAVILRDFNAQTVDQFTQANKDGKFWERFREDMMLRATLPEIRMDSLPPNITAGDAYLIWQSPATEKDAVYAAIDMTIDDGSGVPIETTSRIGFMETKTGNELRISLNIRNLGNAFGIDGLDLHSVTMLMAVNAASEQPGAVPTVGVGLAASMTIGDREVAVAGRVDFSLVTGNPMKVALRGELSLLSSRDLIALANRLSGLDEDHQSDSDLPEIELRDVVLNIAPFGGDVELGIEDGIGFKADLLVNGEMIARVDGLIDQTQDIPKIRMEGWTAEMDLGDLKVSEVTVDVLMAQSADDHYILKGRVEVLGAVYDVDIHSTADRMYFHIITEVPGLGLTDYEFESSTQGIPRWTFNAIVRNDLSHTMEETVAADLRSWSDQATKDFAKAQSDLDYAQSQVNLIQQDINDAMKEAQAEYDQINSDLAAAERLVDSRESRVNSLIASERKAYSAWKAAVRSRKKAKWYNYSSRKAKEVSRYSTYRKIYASRISAQASLRTAQTALTVVRASAGWALNAAGPEAHPEVVSLNAKLALRTAALDTAKAAVKVAEVTSTGAADVAAFAAEHHDDLFMINQIRFNGSLSAAIINSSFDLQVDYRFMGEDKSFQVAASTEVDFDRLAADLFAEAKRVANAGS